MFLSTDVIAPDAAAEAPVIFTADLDAVAHDGCLENGMLVGARARAAVDIRVARIALKVAEL